jgi:hypothetical protein
MHPKEGHLKAIQSLDPFKAFTKDAITLDASYSYQFNFKNEDRQNVKKLNPNNLTTILQHIFNDACPFLPFCLDLP